MKTVLRSVMIIVSVAALIPVLRAFPTTYSGLTVDGSGNHVFTYESTETDVQRASRLSSVISSLAYDASFENLNGTAWDGVSTKYPKRLRFEAATYNFDLGSSGQLSGFTAVSHLTILGTGTNSQSVLKWYTQTTDSPHSFFSFDYQCDTILINYLMFDTGYTMRADGVAGTTNRINNSGTTGTVPYNQAGSDGSHIKITGHNITIDNNVFEHAPGHAIYAFVDRSQRTTYPHDIHIDNNQLYENFGDGIHMTGYAHYVVGNTISGTGDDAIAFYNDDAGNYDTPNSRYFNDCISTDNHILSNTITNSGWRGIFVASSTYTEIDGNQITNTGRNGIEVSTISVREGSFSWWPNYVSVTDNTVSGTGWAAAHHTVTAAGYTYTSHLSDENQYYNGHTDPTNYPASAGLFGWHVTNGLWTNNTVTHTSGYNGEIYYPLYVWMGKISNYGTPGQYASGQTPDGRNKITYYIGPSEYGTTSSVSTYHNDGAGNYYLNVVDY